MKLAKYLANLGYGTRREVEQMVGHGRVTDGSGLRLREGDAFAHEGVRVDGEPLDPPPGSLLLLHKPVGYVCSTSDANPLVYDLLPPRFRLRSPIIAPIGRLDRDTSGLLLLTDDGSLNHRVASPKAHLPKRYEATLASDLTGDEAALFSTGTLLLEGETDPLKPAELEVIEPRLARVTVREGRYHQVRRMFVAAGNHVLTLQRTAIGPLALEGLPAGSWRLASPSEIAALRR